MENKMSAMNKSRTGIIVFGFSRPEMLRNLLESLKRQGVSNDVHVWLDGYHGNFSYKDAVETCRDMVRTRFPEFLLTAVKGNLGINKMMIDGLSFMAQRYRRIIILEDDCFPVSGAVEAFEQALDEIENRPGVYSVYGHPFLTQSEGETITRFQGWGWATTREKLLPVLQELRQCFNMSEPDYFLWVNENLTPGVVKRLDVTPGRSCIVINTKVFIWDACTCLITAVRGLVHKKTRRRVIYNCGMEGQHFSSDSKWRKPPFNMIAPGEVWDVFQAPQTAPAPQSKEKEREEKPYLPYLQAGDKLREESRKTWQNYYRIALDILKKKESKTPLDRYRMASIYKKLGDYGAAREEFERLHQQCSDNKLAGGACFHLADIHYSLKDIKKAKIYLTLCLEYNPAHNEASLFLAKIGRNSL